MILFTRSQQPLPRGRICFVTKITEHDALRLDMDAVNTETTLRMASITSRLFSFLEQALETVFCEGPVSIFSLKDRSMS